MKRPSFSITLAAIPACIIFAVLLIAAAPDEVESVVAAAAMWMIAVGAAFMAIYVAPSFKVDRETRIAGIVFFALTSILFANAAFSIAFDNESSFAEDAAHSWWILSLITIQLFATGRFILGLRSAMVIMRDRLHKLEGRPELGRRAADSEIRDVA